MGEGGGAGLQEPRRDLARRQVLPLRKFIEHGVELRISGDQQHGIAHRLAVQIQAQKGPAARGGLLADKLDAMEQMAMLPGELGEPFAFSKLSARLRVGETFNGWLMSDGFWAYRGLDQRLRCLAHLIRKAQALEDDLEPAAQRFGSKLLTVIATVMAAVYDARGAPPPAGTLRARHAPMLNALLDECLHQVDAPHEKTRAGARVAQRLGHLLGGARPSGTAADQQ